MTANRTRGDDKSLSGRGKFETFRAPPIPSRTNAEPATRDDIAHEPGTAELSAVLGLFDYSGLLKDNREEEVRKELAAMVAAMLPGSAVTVLFAQPGRNGMSLGHAWFGPNLPLYRHSHPKFGDCLYYVLAGEISLGRQVLRAGDGFFVPNGMPYKYRAGPQGCEVLEFRSGGGIKGAAHTSIDEVSLDGIRKVTEACRANRHLWSEQPPCVSSAPLVGTSGKRAQPWARPKR